MFVRLHVTLRPLQESFLLLKFVVYNVRIKKTFSVKIYLDRYSHGYHAVRI